MNIEKIHFTTLNGTQFFIRLDPRTLDDFMEQNRPYAEEEYIKYNKDQLGDDPPRANFWDLEPFMNIGREPEEGAEVTRWTEMDNFFSHIAAHLNDLGFNTRDDGRDINLITKDWNNISTVYRLEPNRWWEQRPQAGEETVFVNPRAWLEDHINYGANLLNGVTHVVLSLPRRRRRGGAKSKKTKKKKKKKVSFKQKRSTDNMLKKTDKLLKLITKQLNETEEDLDLRDIGERLNNVGLYLAKQKKKDKRFERRLKMHRHSAQFNPDGLLGGRRKRKRTRKRRKKRKHRW
ncbi:hypothetical protein OAI84_00345 [bacterium]|nr:hypothetical protein [bacterium]